MSSNKLHTILIFMLFQPFAGCNESDSKNSSNSAGNDGKNITSQPIDKDIDESCKDYFRFSDSQAAVDELDLSGPHVENILNLGVENSVSSLEIKNTIQRCTPLKFSLKESELGKSWRIEIQKDHTLQEAFDYLKILGFSYVRVEGFTVIEY